VRLEAAAALPAVLRPNLKHRDRCRWERADAHGLQQNGDVQTRTLRKVTEAPEAPARARPEAAVVSGAGPTRKAQHKPGQVYYSAEVY
jgi:hypothetical protein